MSNEKFIEAANYAWLGLGDTSKLETKKIFADCVVKDELESAFNFIKIITQPEYLHIFCKEICNVNLAPHQCVSIQELWNHRFPMLIAARGYGKTYLMALYTLIKCVLVPKTRVVLTGAGFRQSKLIFENIESIWNNAPILRDICNNSSGCVKESDRWKFNINSSVIYAVPIGCMTPDTLVTTSDGIRELQDLRINDDKNMVWANGDFRQQGFFYEAGICESYNVKTQAGFEYTATPNHKMKVARNNTIEWVRTDELILGDRILIDRTLRWHNGDTDASENDAYCLGLMIGDGCYSKPKKLRYTSIDSFLHEKSRHIGNFHMNPDNQHSDLNVKQAQEWMDFWGLEPAIANSKVIPQKMLNSSKDKMRECLRGLFDTDGGISILCKNTEPSGIIGYTTVSKKLAKQLQYILLHFGIIAKLSSRDRLSPYSGNPAQRCYELRIGGNDIEVFRDEIGFGLPRKQKILEEFIEQRRRRKSYGDTIPLDKTLFHKSVTKDRKTLTFDRAFECELSHELINKDYFYDTVISVEQSIDQPMYDINIPEGNEYGANGFFSHNTGEKIRGLRANLILADEFNSIDPNIFEKVVQGFASVELEPILKMQEAAKRNYLIENGAWTPDQEFDYEKAKGNQTIISGTAGYDFQHFAKYWKDYHNIICGDQTRIANVLGEHADKFSPRDFCIIRYPYELIPEGFMDDKTISKAKIMTNSGIFNMEYNAIFIKDSEGFFKRTLIESCVAKESSRIQHPKSGVVTFDARIEGNSSKRHVIAIDPASEEDNLAITILELHEDHWRVVYCWTTNRKTHRKRVQAKVISQENYYSYCARKIRDLMKLFPVVRIAIDGQGGGRPIMEALHDISLLEQGEELLWPVVDPEKPADTDHKQGAHIIEKIEFANAEWTSEANHGLRKDMEMKYCLFPRCDGLTISLATEEDIERIQERMKRDNKDENPENLEKYSASSDSLEDCIFEIEELKNELAVIVMSRTPNGRDRWDTPELKLANGRKGRMRKDRYSSLLMANMVARSLSRAEPALRYAFVGGLKQDLAGKAEVNKEKNSKMYTGAGWYNPSANTFRAINRK